MNINGKRTARCENQNYCRTYPFYLIHVFVNFLLSVGGADFLCVCTLAVFSKIYSVLRIKSGKSNEEIDNLLMT
jgi:hypothetical protein